MKLKDFKDPSITILLIFQDQNHFRPLSQVLKIREKHVFPELFMRSRNSVIYLFVPRVLYQIRTQMISACEELTANQ